MEFTEDYLLDKDHIKWQQDDDFKVFNDALTTQTYTFKQVKELCAALVPSDVTEKQTAQMEHEWETLVIQWSKTRAIEGAVNRNEWDKIQKRLSEKAKNDVSLSGGSNQQQQQPAKALGFVAVCYFMSLLPFEELSVEALQKAFCRHELNVLNVLYCYLKHHSSSRLLECGAQDPVAMPPVFPPAWQQFFNQQYDACVWWATYMVYERKQGRKHALLTKSEMETSRET